MKPFLSVCMIVKNEEKVLTRCLESIFGIADEIIIADTGSIDTTKKIASEYTNLVYDFQWNDDFSEARNFAASKANGDWILVIDADEYVERESFLNFKENLKNNPLESNIVAVQIVNFVGVKGINTTLNYHERLYKNDGTISYYRNIHELLKHNDSNELRNFSEFQIYHSGYMKNTINEKEKSKRNLTLLINKENKEPIDYYFIGNEYDQLGNIEKAIEYYQKGFKLKDNIHYDWVQKLLLRLVNCLHKAKRDTEALQILNYCEEIYLDIVDYRYYMGQIYYDNSEYNNAKVIFEGILAQKGQLKADSSIDFLEFLPHKFLGEIYEKEKLYHKAVQHYTKALSLNDEDEYLWMRLINLLANHSSIEELSNFLNNNLLNKKNMTALRVVKILHSVPILNVQKLTRSLLEEQTLSPIEREALLLKNLQFDGCLEDILEILNKKSSAEIVSLISKGIFNIIDFIIFTNQVDNVNYQSIVRDIKFDKPINNLLNIIYLGKRKTLSNFEQDFFSLLLKQAYILQNEKTINILSHNINCLTMDNKKKLKRDIEEFNLIQ